MCRSKIHFITDHAKSNPITILPSALKKAALLLTALFYWESGQGCWMHSGLWECAISSPSWEGQSQAGTAGQGRAVLGSRGRGGQRQSGAPSRELQIDTENCRWSSGLGLSLHFYFYTSNGETNTLQRALPFIYSTLPSPHVFMGYTATEGLQRSSNVTSWKTFHLTFKRRQRKGKDPFISNP